MTLKDIVDNIMELNKTSLWAITELRKKNADEEEVKKLIDSFIKLETANKLLAILSTHPDIQKMIDVCVKVSQELLEDLLASDKGNA